MGGYNYLLNLCRVVGTWSNGRMTPVMFVGEDMAEDDITPFRDMGCEVVCYPAATNSQRLGRFIRAFITGRDKISEQLFREHHIDLVFEHATYFGWRFGLPTISWLGDFQHRYLPDMFELKAYWKRELGMRVKVLSGRTIMVSSELDKRNCEKFFGLSGNRVHAVRFAVPAPFFRSVDAKAICERYDLPEHFFHLPNQFWKHKNHRLVLNALKLLHDTGIVIVATGRCEDTRFPEYFPEILEAIKAEGLENNFRVLGVVPYSDMLNLMQASVAVINPSLFEGWSTTVEEARALGVSLLLSDIPVHREQMGTQAQYFAVDAPEQLAELLSQCLAKANQKKIVNQTALEDDNHAHLNRFVSDFERAALASVATKNL